MPRGRSSLPLHHVSGAVLQMLAATNAMLWQGVQVLYEQGNQQ